MNPNKIILKEKLSELRGGSEDDCCFIFCPGGLYCGVNGTGDCQDMDMEEGCSALPGSCENCWM